MNKPLQGIKVLDFSRLLPGPVCSLALADLGADVIKVEDSPMGDYARTVVPLAKSTSRFFLSVNRNKRSYCVNLKSSSDLMKLKKLIQKSDILIESYRPGVMKKLGLDFFSMQTLHPGLIYCSITGYGQSGKNSQKAGHDLNFLAETAILRKMPGFQKLAPINMQMADIIGGANQAAIAILAALFRRTQTGQGDYIDVSMFHSLLSSSHVALSNLGSAQSAGIDLTDMLNGDLHCYHIYPTADDRHVALAALESKFWDRFCDAAGKGEWKSKHLCFGEEETAMRKQLESYFIQRTSNEINETFGNVDCCLSLIALPEEAFTDDQTSDRKIVQSYEHPSEGKIMTLAYPVKFHATELSEITPAPQLGEHNAEIEQEFDLI